MSKEQVDQKPLGQIAFESFIFSMRSPRWWTDLSDEEQAAWNEAAKAVARPVAKLAKKQARKQKDIEWQKKIKLEATHDYNHNQTFL